MGTVSSIWRRYRGDPTPPAGAATADTMGAIADTVDAEPIGRNGVNGVPELTADASVAFPIQRTTYARPARSWLLFPGFNYGQVKVPQAGGARRLFANRVPGDPNQSSVVQARDSQRIDRPVAAPWDRGGAIGGE